jgi:lipoate-protein ligase A
MDQARLIIDPALHGAWNMAVDQALLATVNATGQPVLRFYRWSPATLSLGYFQSAAERAGHVASATCDLVRRVTGGGAILHDLELTYSVCVPNSSRLSGQNQWLYQQVHGAVIEALGHWKIRPTIFADRERVDDKSRFLCFQRRSPGDLVVGDHKICGSAQRRVERAILQHGSILLEHSHFAPELPGIHEIAGVRVDPAELAGLIGESLSRRLDWTFLPSKLDSNEHAVACEIRQKQFGHYDWNFRR